MSGKKKSRGMPYLFALLGLTTLALTASVASADEMDETETKQQSAQAVVMQASSEDAGVQDVTVSGDETVQDAAVSGDEAVQDDGTQTVTDQQEQEAADQTADPEEQSDKDGETEQAQADSSDAAVGSSDDGGTAVNDTDEVGDGTGTESSDETVTVSDETSGTSDESDVETADDQEAAESADDQTDAKSAGDQADTESTDGTTPAGRVAMKISTSAVTHINTWHGIDFSPVYDYDYYVTNNPERQGADDSATLENFIRNDLMEGTSAKESATDEDRADFRSKMQWIVDHIDNMITSRNGKDYSLVYDYAYYLYNNQDVAEVSKGDPTWALWHFLTYGMKEERQAISTFDEKSYRRAYQDLRLAFGSQYPQYYNHYINYGAKEGRSQVTGVTEIQDPITTYKGLDLSDLYDYDYYISNNPDLEKSFGENDYSAVWHFATYGMKEGRKGKESYDEAEYAELKPIATHLFRASNVNGGLDYSPVYNYLYYALNNRDVTSYYNGDPVNMLSHFIICGMMEQRKGNASFDEASYRRAYQDLRRAFGMNYRKYYLHYIKSGRREGRSRISGVTDIQYPISDYAGVDFSSIYNFYYYRDQSPDLRKLYGEDDAAYIAHFVVYGVREGRKSKSSYSAATYNRLKTVSQNLRKATTVYGGRDYSPIYNYLYYAWNNKDVTDRLGYAPSTVLAHFSHYGIMEGRRARASYSQATYNAIRQALIAERTLSPKLRAMANIASGISSATNYLLLVNKSTYTVAAFRGSVGNWSLVRSFSCVVGKPSTPSLTGSYAISGRKPYFDSGRARCFYATRIYGGYYFHTVLYAQTATPQRIIDGTMGAAASHGCIRLELSNARWIYNTVPNGSKVFLYG